MLYTHIAQLMTNVYIATAACPVIMLLRFLAYSESRKDSKGVHIILTQQKSKNFISETFLPKFSKLFSNFKV